MDGTNVLMLFASAYFPLLLLHLNIPIYRIVKSFKLDFTADYNPGLGGGKLDIQNWGCDNDKFESLLIEYEFSIQTYEIVCILKM